MANIIALIGCGAVSAATLERRSEIFIENQGKKIQMTQVPEDYYEIAEQQGSLEHFSYMAKRTIKHL